VVVGVERAARRLVEGVGAELLQRIQLGAGGGQVGVRRQVQRTDARVRRGQALCSQVRAQRHVEAVPPAVEPLLLCRWDVSQTLCCELSASTSES
jgi:hypothetical protein